MRDLSIVSLFSGAGGLDLGLEQAGAGSLSIRSWIEWDADARATLMANRPSLRRDPAFFSDIFEVQAKEVLKAAGLRPEETFLLAGGPPCQAFSTAGLRQGVNDTNGRLVHNYFQMVKYLKPRFFVFENVRGLLSAALVHRPLNERASPQEVPDDENEKLGSVMQKIILPNFRKLGYEVIYGLLNAADYGSAQVRHRLFVMGSRDKEFRAGVFRKQTSRAMMPLDLVPATHHRTSPYPPIQSWRTLKDVIGDRRFRDPEPKDTYSYSKERGDIFRRIPAGENWRHVRDNQSKYPRGYLAQIMGNAINSGGGKEGFWRRLSWSAPAPTLTAQPQQLATSLCHPEEIRPLSIREYSAIQDFPSGYRFEGSKSSRYRQIGNAVPVRLAAALGRSILAVANELPRWDAKEEKRLRVLTGT